MNGLQAPIVSVQLSAVRSPFRMWGLWFSGTLAKPEEYRHPIVQLLIVSTRMMG